MKQNSIFQYSRKCSEKGISKLSDSVIHNVTFNIFSADPLGGGLGFQQGCGHMFVCLYASPNQVIDISSLRGDIFWEYSEDI